MTDSTPKVDPKHYQAAGEQPKLVDAAHKAFRAMWWPGMGLLTIAAIVIIIGFAQGDNEYGRAGAFAFAGGTLQLALLLLVGAGVVSGLGRRVRDSEPSNAEQRGTE